MAVLRLVIISYWLFLCIYLNATQFVLKDMSYNIYHDYYMTRAVFGKRMF